jgi:hypothetical protein
VTLDEFEQEVFRVAGKSRICGVPTVRALTPTSENIRVPLTMGGYVDAFFNSASGTTAFALVQNDRRIFGADNTGGWHLHSFENPESHVSISQATTFSQFIRLIETHYSVAQ